MTRHTDEHESAISTDTAADWHPPLICMVPSQEPGSCATEENACFSRTVAEEKSVGEAPVCWERLSSQKIEVKDRHLSGTTNPRREWLFVSLRRSKKYILGCYVTCRKRIENQHKHTLWHAMSEGSAWHSSILATIWPILYRCVYLCWRGCFSSSACTSWKQPCAEKTSAGSDFFNSFKRGKRIHVHRLSSRRSGKCIQELIILPRVPCFAEKKKKSAHNRVGLKFSRWNEEDGKRPQGWKWSCEN